jgi:hypothetical protein
MAIFILVAVVVDGLMVWGFIRSRNEKGIDRRHYASFVGFAAAVTAVTVTTLVMVVGAPHTRPSDAIAAFLFSMSWVALISILATFVAGLFSQGFQRLTLVGCGVVVALMFLFNIAGHFGD